MMRISGFLLLLAGWAIDLTAVAILKAVTQQTIFVLAGTAVQLLGMGLVVRSHLIPRGDRG